MGGGSSLGGGLGAFGAAAGGSNTGGAPIEYDTVLLPHKRVPHPMLWQCERYAAADEYRIIYPTLADELVIEGVYVRLYLKEKDLLKAKPEPRSLALSLLNDLHDVHAKYRVYDPIPEKELKLMAMLLQSGATLLVRVPRLRFVCAESPHIDALVTMLGRDLLAHTRTMRMGRGEGDEVGGMKGALWSQAIHSATAMASVVANSPKGAVALGP